MKSKETIERRLKSLEREMGRQTDAVYKSGEGWGGNAGLQWDTRCIERRTLQWVLGIKHQPFNAADTMAGW